MGLPGEDGEVVSLSNCVTEYNAAGFILHKFYGLILCST